MSIIKQIHHNPKDRDGDCRTFNPVDLTQITTGPVAESGLNIYSLTIEAVGATPEAAISQALRIIGMLNEHRDPNGISTGGTSGNAIGKWIAISRS